MCVCERERERERERREEGERGERGERERGYIYRCWAAAHEHLLPPAGVYHPAFNLVLGHYAGELWQGLGDFEEVFFFWASKKGTLRIFFLFGRHLPTKLSLYLLL